MPTTQQLKDALVATVGTLLQVGGVLVATNGHLWEGVAVVLVGFIGYVVYEKF